MTDIAFMPKRDIFQRNHCVAADDASQTAQPFAGNWVALMRHGRTAFLSFCEKFLHFENFGSLEMTKFSRPTVDA